MPRLLVTGAAGFIGSHTVDHLLAHGHEVVGVDNFRSGREENLAAARAHPGFTFRQLDVLDAAALAQLCRQHPPDGIIHLAALVSVPESFKQPELNRQLNYEATRVVAELARTLPSVRRLVFSSSAAVYGNSTELHLREEAACRPLSPYGEAKRDSERLLQELHRSCPRVVPVSLRYFNVYGSRQDPSSPYSGVISRFSRALEANEPLTIHGDGEQTRDFIAVADVARANALAATAARAPAILNICTGRAVSLNALLHTLGEVLGRQPQPTYGPARPGDIRHSCGAPEAALRQLAFRADVTLSAGLRSLVTRS
jgi:UDP-glucose 4-epimerase